jgi:hypothetical protein
LARTIRRSENQGYGVDVDGIDRMSSPACHRREVRRENDLRARLYAVEILLAELLADKARATPDPAEAIAAASWIVQPVISDLPLQEPNLDAEAKMRQGIEGAVGEIMKMVVARLS